MGPQLYRCGNEEQVRELKLQVLTLQWGRNFIVAEIIHLVVSHYHWF